MPLVGSGVLRLVRSSSGSLAMLAAMRRASSRVRSLAAARRPASSSKIDVGEGLQGPLTEAVEASQNSQPTERTNARPRLRRPGAPRPQKRT